MIDTDHWIGLRRKIHENVTENNVTSDYMDNSTIVPYHSTVATVTVDSIVSSSSVVNSTNSTSNYTSSTNSTSNYTQTPCKSWCKWSNGEPLIFQNWHPGMPVFKSRLPEIKCCSCSCTCPKSTARVTTMPVSPTASPSIQTTVMEYLSKTTGQMNLTTDNETTSAKIYHDPSSPSQASETTGARTTLTESTVGESTTQMDSTETTNKEETTTEREKKTTQPSNREILLSCTTKESTTLGQTTRVEGISTAGESTTSMKNLRQTITQEGISTAGESTTSINNLGQATSQEGISNAGESTTGMENLVLTTNKEGISTAEDTTNDMENLSVTTTQNGLTTAGNSESEVETLLLTTNQEGFTQVGESEKNSPNLPLSTNPEGFSTVGDSTSDMENFSVTATQEGFSTVGKSTTSIEDVLLTTNQEEFSTEGEMTTKTQNQSVNTTQVGFSTVGDRATDIESVSLPTAQEEFSKAGDSTTDMENLLLTTNQEGFSTVGERTTEIKNLSVTTTQEGIRTAGDITTDNENLSVTQKGSSTARDRTTDLENLSMTTIQEAFSTFGDSTTHWKGCETTNQEAFLTCKVVERTTDNCLETTTDSESTTVVETISVTTNQESTFQTDTPFTTDKTTSRPITRDTTGMTTDTQEPVTSPQSPTTFEAYESSTGSIWTTTLPSTEPTCEQSPVETEILAEINENYIEDSCVVMTSFGPWVEKRCLEMLPFICYEDRFFGQVNVTNETSESATLTWLPGPGDISHYIVEVNGVELNENVTGLTLDLFNLTAGSLYDVKVFPVKCDRSLNPQNASFYTRPYKVNNLTVDRVTENSVYLKWKMTDGNASFYIVKTNDLSENVSTTNLEFKGLTPGSCYTFSVTSGVHDQTKESEKTYVTGCTKPAKVSNLKVTNITVSSLIVSWEILEGYYTGFDVNVSYATNTMFINVNQTEVTLTNLTSGTKINISVWALSNSLMGNITTIITHTAPENVTDIILTSENNLINVTWKYPGGSSVTFFIEVWKDDEKCQTQKTLEMNVQIKGLKSSTKYKVEIYAVSGEIEGPKQPEYIYTLPTPPTDVKVEENTADSLTLKWEAPDKITKARYKIHVTSIWDVNGSNIVHIDDTTSMKFTNLKSGTNYSFEVFTIAGNNESLPASCSGSTVPDKMEISLSMLCSSAESLACANYNEKDLVEKLEYFLKNGTINDQVFWEF
ncbi:mucin-3A [Oryzias melastigma]|uniref:mucin-3A n=1 Tax=Oryzias melastigma TaxID=30732 RepID=UPI000CF80277|nr:mucin-3A [Oryzias melastigma]